MEQLRNIELLNLGEFTVNMAQLAVIGFFAGILLFVYWLIEYKLFPWYYGMDSTSEVNRGRMRRAVRFTAFGFIVVVILRTLNLDEELINIVLEQLSPEELKRIEMENPEAANDGSGLRFIVRISTLVKVLIAYIVANILDLVLGEIITQRFHRIRTVARKKGTTIAGNEPSRIRWLRPVLITLVIMFFATETGLAFYHPFTIPTNADGTGGIDLTIGKMLKATLVFLLVNLLLSFFISFLLKGYYDRNKIDTGSQFAINRLLTYFAYLIGVLLVIQAAGFNLIGIWTGAAALLVGIGIGLQQTFNDLICGIIMLFERSVKVGDVIELSGHEVGTVRKIGTRTSILETRDDIIIFVPNSKLIGENVRNWSQVERKARFHVKVGVAYGSDTSLVKELMIKAAKDHNRVLDSPPPFVRFLDFGDSSLDFDVIFWTRDLMRVEDTKSDIRLSIDAAFRARNIEIPFPQRDLWIRGGLPQVGAAPTPPETEDGTDIEEVPD
ncbi:mechanosensitive ion channel [Neolewinella aurantiaca]|uniref:Mechanosensitive ion channel n=1 Tax=Neolewinella aurantiaca TaxID=2602767 RepID=A0A5C7FJ78_9BACT|nr:mechanosensitive ion channel domain-containing protein [Neolewinella aurantiaca]TXF89905.1 mechanosensitive ion channel [Neolewinella aurantiaca]